MIGYSSAIYGEGGSDRIVQASELPTDSIVPESKIQEIKQKIQDGEVSINLSTFEPFRYYDYFIFYSRLNQPLYMRPY